MTQKRLWQSAVLIAGLVPVTAGLSGVFFFPVEGVSDFYQNHVRYLSGLLLVIGMCFWSFIPHPERHVEKIKLLTIIVFTGGLCRLLGCIMSDGFSGPIIFALGMELFITPALYFWLQIISKNQTCSEGG